MNKIIKIIFLIVMLAVPLAIFIFLKIFGENRFDIPVYYESGVDKVYEGCTYSEGQYLVPDSLMPDHKDALFMLFKEDNSYNIDELNNQLNRLSELYAGDIPEVTIFAVDSVSGSGLKTDYISWKQINPAIHCALITDKVNQFILVDRQRRIRGYYDTDLDEMDRLVVEIKILLENGARE